MLIKIFLGFLLIALAETLNGIFRVRVLHKKLGAKTARLVSFILGSLIIFLINIILLPWINPKTISEAFFIGFVWMSLMIVYDLYVGRVLFKLSWDKILEDFNIFKGNLLALGMMLILFLPLCIKIFT
jgi:hypothetical protein